MTVRGLSARIAYRRSPTFGVDVDLAIPPATTTALVGPNGAGKSTVVDAIAGLIAVDHGRITLDGRTLDDPESDVLVAAEDRRIGVMFQSNLLFPHLSVLDNVAFGLRRQKLGRSAARDRAMSWLARLDVDGAAGRKPGELSGGQTQRVALARALATEPDLLLLDEPTSALDAGARPRMRRTLMDHLDVFPGPRLIISHDATEAYALADDVVVIEDGSITQIGTPDDIRLRPATPYAAQFAGANVIRGHAEGGRVVAGDHTLFIADHDVRGSVTVSIPASAASIHLSEPEGSQRNRWHTSIERVERLGDRVRVAVGAPLPLTIEVTADASDALGLEHGADVWVAVKATEIHVDGEANPEGDPFGR